VTRLLLRRLLLLLPTLLGITVVTFALSRAAPGGPLSFLLPAEGGRGLSAAEFEEARHLRGFDRPLHEQYLGWLGKAICGDFGVSEARGGRPVADLIRERAATTVVLQSIAVLLIWLIGVPLGAWSAVRAGTRRERLVGGLLFALDALPAVVIGTVLIAVFCVGSGAALPLLWASPPSELTGSSRIAHMAEHALLPVACLVLASLAGVARYSRAGLLETMRQPWIHALRARGIPERRVLFVHALRTGILPLVTLISSIFPWLVAGSVAVETLFSIPGLGRFAFESVRDRDDPSVMANALLVGSLTWFGFLVSDLLHVLLGGREEAA
jgi:peptide/nickel transport system permease protein